MKTKWISTIIVSFMIIVTIKSFLITSYKVEGDSMAPTLKSGSFVFVNVLHDTVVNPKEGDIYFLKLNQSSTLVKRIVATPNDHINIMNNRLYVNGEKTKYKSKSLHQLVQGEDTFGYTLPSNCYYVLGDHLEKSTDSRTFGCVKLDEMLGKVVYTYWEENK